MTAPDVNDVRARFEAELVKLPAGAQANIRDAMSRDESLSFDMFTAGYRAAHADLAGEVRELVEALELAKRAYWLARNSAAGLTNYCEESASSRRCERELSEAESLWHSAGIEAALAKFHPTQQEKP